METLGALNHPGWARAVDGVHLEEGRRGARARVA
jgi:hypothetical protein